jgi:hypothetical protein
MDATGAFQLPVGILVNSNTGGVGSIGSVFVVDSSATIGSTILRWNQIAASTADFLAMDNSSAVELFSVDYLGNIHFKVAGAATGNRIYGDMTNATAKSRLAFETTTADSNTNLGILPSGTALISQLNLYNANDPDNAGRLSIQANSHIINSTKSGTGSTLALALCTNTVTALAIGTSQDLLLGKAAAAAGDTSGHMYIQAHANAPTGAPLGSAGYVAMRYDTANNFLYIYNGGWKKSTVYA